MTNYIIIFKQVVIPMYKLWILLINFIPINLRLVNYVQKANYLCTKAYNANQWHIDIFGEEPNVHKNDQIGSVKISSNCKV